MLTKNPAEQPASELSEPKTTLEVVDPRAVIEAASSGGGTVNDPAGNDNRPPGCADLDLLA
ncbi:MAG TPA: hypothetical protein VEW48_20060 [Thermoanaerobaculia bacterium]|nr:hypothetical protein [Thermoanaerobaculia bacterium]